MRKLWLPMVLLAVVGMQGIAQGDPKKEVDGTRPFVLGVIEELQSGVLNEKRVLNIYLPDGYTDSDTVRYPVVYLLDGSADEDFIHVAGLFQFNNFPWINRVPKSIVVGIANTNRKRDFTFPSTIDEDKRLVPVSGHSDRFISFIRSELQPFIEKKYKTNSGKMLIGQSLGGLLATEILLNEPQLFDKYIIISPSLWWNDGSLLAEKSFRRISGYNRQTDIYIGVGKEGVAPTLTPHVMEVDANILVDQLRKTKNEKLKIIFDYLPGENHATITHQAVFNALRMLYPEKGETK